MMNNPIDLKTLFSEAERTPDQELSLFGLVTLGILESLSSGLVSASEALDIFFNADNCLFVRQQLRERAADEIMSHGVQLSDLFDVLPMAEAQREFQRELTIMRALCLELLEEKQLVM
jgi:hypothetical protein